MSSHVSLLSVSSRWFDRGNNKNSLFIKAKKFEHKGSKEKDVAVGHFDMSAGSSSVKVDDQFVSRTLMTPSIQTPRQSRGKKRFARGCSHPLVFLRFSLFICRLYTSLRSSSALSPLFNPFKTDGTTASGWHWQKLAEVFGRKYNCLPAVRGSPVCAVV